MMATAKPKRSGSSRRVAGVTIPPELLDVEHPCWHDDAADLAEHRHRSREVQEAALRLVRRRRHLEAVEAWALEHGWTGEVRRSPRLVRRA